jgi:hypothetical protein
LLPFGSKELCDAGEEKEEKEKSKWRILDEN